MLELRFKSQDSNPYRPPQYVGFFWIIFDARKQGFHAKLANTLVVRTHG